MTMMLPSLHEFNLNNGLSSTREPMSSTMSARAVSSSMKLWGMRPAMGRPF